MGHTIDYCLQQGMPGGLALLWMKLNANHVIVPYRCHYRFRIACNSNPELDGAVIDKGMVEIEVPTMAKSKQWIFSHALQHVPSYMPSGICYLAHMPRNKVKP
jgi:hypothetical protein